jgi:Methyltransferase domain
MHPSDALAAITADTGLGLVLDRRSSGKGRTPSTALMFDRTVELGGPNAAVQAWLVRAAGGAALPEIVSSPGCPTYVRIMDRFYMPEVRDVEVTRAMFDLIADLYDDLADKINLATAIGLLSAVLEGAPPSPLLLDFGCGTGIAVEALAAVNIPARLLGVDLSDAMLRRAYARGEPVMTIDRWRADETPIDGAIAAFVLHYGVPEPDLIAIAKRLRPYCRFAANVFKSTEVELDKLTATVTAAGLTLVKRGDAAAGTRSPNPVVVFEKAAS